MKTRPKKVVALGDLMAAAWNDNAPDAVFAGMTLAQFRTTTQASSAKRDEVLSLTSQRRAKRGEQNAVDETSRDAIQRVVAAIKADPQHGQDSPLLTAMGYVTRSQRKSGLTRKTQAPANVTPLAKAA